MNLRKHRLRLPIAAAVVVVIGGAGATYAVAGGEDAPRYRTVAATTSDVEQTLSSSGLVDAAARADLGFGTDGTIAKLKVAIGDVVKTGQVLATLDTTDLDAAVTEAESSLAKAVAQLASDRAAQSSSVSAASNPTGSSGDKPTGNDSAASAAVLKELKKLQDAVIAAQSTASQALAAAKEALATQNEVCATANTAAATTEETDTEEPADDGQDACAVALADVAAKQDVVATAQDALAKALNDLAGALTKALGSVSAPQTSARTSATTSAATQDTGSSSPSSGNTITAARLASDQAQIEQAKADLVTAEQNREQATLRSTRSGKVVALDAAAGDAVSAGSTVVTVVGGKAVTVTGTATETQLDLLQVGQTVRVTVPGSTTSATGRLTQIGLVADTSSGTTSYPFTVTVEDPTIALPTGSRALLQVVLATADDVVTVPTSAVVRDGDDAVVEVLDDGKVVRTDVKVGTVGSRTVEITEGLTSGQRVVLAAMDDPIKGAESELNQRGGFNGPPTVRFSGPGGAGGGPVTFGSRN